MLESDDFDLKVDNNRIIYVKKKTDSSFKSIGSEIPRGYTTEEKKKFIYSLYQMVLARKSELHEMKKEVTNN